MTKKARKIVSREVYNSHKESAKQAKPVITDDVRDRIIREYLSKQAKPVVMNHKKPATVKPEPVKAKKAEKAVKTEGVQIVKYNDKSIAVIGDTKPIKEQLYELKGRFNRFLRIEGKQVAGWIFSATRLKSVESFVNSL